MRVSTGTVRLGAARATRRHPRGWRLPLVLPLTVAAVALAAPTAAAQQVVNLGAGGNQGATTLYQGSCKYRIFGPRGVLQVGMRPPLVGGANTHRGTRGEQTLVRYRVYLTDVGAAHRTLATSSWSSFIRARESQRLSWTGFTSFERDWRGHYGLDVRIEWWRPGSMVGWKALRLRAFQYFDHYNRGPYGPLTWCARYYPPE